MRCSSDRQPGPPVPDSQAPGRTVEVTSAAPSVADSVRDLWAHRELVYFLAWRDVRVRYKQAALGFAWAVVRPVLMMAVFSVLLSRVSDDLETGGAPYPVFAFVGLLLWLYFQTAVLGASESLVASANLVSKTYFPRLALPLSALLAQLPDLLLGFGVLAIIMAVAGVGVGVQVLLLPLVVLLLLLVAFALGVGLSAVNVRYRDVKHALPFLMQIWLFASPVLYPSSYVPERFRVLYAINPVAGLMELARWCVLDTPLPSFALLGTSLAVFVLILLGGLRYFRRTENTFADVI